MPVEVGALALIIEDDRLLCIQKHDQVETYTVLPGGAQEVGETLEDAVRRACREELGVEVVVHELRFVREYISRNHEFADVEPDEHRINVIFRCSLMPGAEVGGGLMPDDGQVGMLWIPLAELVDARLYPQVLARALGSHDWRGLPVYLGDVN